MERAEMKILLVDDNLSLLDQIRQILTSQRYIVETVSNGEEALDKLCENPFDLIILDIMMPKMDGFTVLREMRQIKIDAPVLMLTAKGDSTDKVKGLDLGADDYLNKPFSMDELLARVRALLRRSTGQSQSVLEFRDLALDTVSRKVTTGGMPVELTPREFSILEFLLHNKDRVVTRFSLAEHVWGDDFDPFSMSNFMDVHMKNLRHKIGDTGTARIIRTVRGVGYIIGDTE
jgi:DNA-binding response OmpR family regulator